MFPRVLLAALFLLASASAQSPDWTTPAERSEYRTTPRYDETNAYFRRIAAAAPRQVRIEEFGRTAQGRPLHIVIVSRDGVFDPAALRRAGRPIVLIQNAIHAGEMDGKDASMALVRDIVITRKHAALIEKAVLLIIPIYNADGHERFGPHHRINQNGPDEMGWRTTAQNLNLNRDYMKADAPETRAFLKLFQRWLPDYFVDNHVTDGADYQYDTTLGVDTGEDVAAGLAAWQRKVFDHIVQRVNAAGNVAGPFIMPRDENDPAKGIVIGQDPPRLSTGYVLLHNRPALLVEMHMLKDYRTRVIGNYWTMVGLLEVINRDAAALLALNRENDAAMIAAGQQGGSSVALKLEATGRTEPMEYRGVRFTHVQSEISGSRWLQYSNEPVTMTIPRQNDLKATLSAPLRAGYIVPVHWTAALEVLRAHGLEMRPLARAWEGTVESWRCSGMKWQQRSFEARHLVDWSAKDAPQCRPVQEKISFPVGSMFVPTGQRAGKVVVHLLEPQAPDSLVSWGFFDVVFEQKEYAEAYKTEKLARDMLARDPALKAEFEKRLAEDKQFAASPGARLNFFYMRSPYWDRQLELYPVGRIGKEMVNQLPLR